MCFSTKKALRKVQIILPLACDEEYLIYLALKRGLTGKSAFNNHQICPALVDGAFEMLAKISQFFIKMLLLILIGKL